MKKPAVLCVDDEVNILEGLQDNLRKQFKIYTATSGAEGLEIIASKGPFPVVISDMRMPEMNGAEFLSKVRKKYPDTLRILLTGQSDIESAISAVNDGQIFRFLTKPCPAEHLSSIIQLAIEHHRLTGLEKDLLENTLRGCVEALVEVLQLTNPVAFSRTNRLRDYVEHIATELNLPDRWQYEVAALLSQVGFVTLPSDTLNKLFAGQDLDEDELALVNEHPKVAYRLIKKIPRLENIASMILRQQVSSEIDDNHAEDVVGIDGAEAAAVTDTANSTEVTPEPEDDVPDNEEIRVGAQLLHIALEYDAHLSSGATHKQIVAKIRKTLDPDLAPLIDCFSNFSASRDSDAAVFKMANVQDLRQGMIFDQEVTDTNGLLLMSVGQLVTDTVIQRLSVFAKRDSLSQPIRVRIAA